MSKDTLQEAACLGPREHRGPFRPTHAFFCSIIIIAIFVLLGQTDSLYRLVPVMIFLLVAASQNARDLLLLLYEPPAEG